MEIPFWNTSLTCTAICCDTGDPVARVWGLVQGSGLGFRVWGLGHMRHG